MVASLAGRRRLRWDPLAHLGKAAVSQVEGTQIHQVRGGGCHIQVKKTNQTKQKQWWGGDVR